MGMVAHWLPVIFFGFYALLTVALVLTNQKLLKGFVNKRPDLVGTHFPEAGVAGRDPRKLFFFLKSSTANILADDAQLLRLRNRLVWLVRTMVLSLSLLAISIVLALILLRQ
jgi:hypothetical protein